MFRDPTLWSLVVSNAITIWLAVAQDWSLGTVLWVYWLQSLIIGFAVLQMLNLKFFNRLSIEWWQPQNDRYKVEIGAVFHAVFWVLSRPLCVFYPGYYGPLWRQLVR